MKQRKADHIEICLDGEVDPVPTFWDDVTLVHEALPEVDYAEIDCGVEFLGKRLEMPLIVTAITGGFEGAVEINSNIAEACAKCGIGMGVGSERAAIEGIETESYEVIKKHKVPLVIGNLGAPQLIAQERKKAFTHDDVARAIEIVGADYIALHLNFLQEAVQPEGDKNARGCRDAFRDIAREFPVIAKETGAGISARTAKALGAIGVRAIDVAGTGGTSFASVELYRAENVGDRLRAELGKTFEDWGIPSTVSVIEASGTVPLIASGGIYNGLDVARSIALGASCAGAARIFLGAAMESADAVVELINQFKEEFRTAMFLTGCRDVGELADADLVITGRTKEWIEGMR